MRAVVQRVSQASVTGGEKTATIGKGLCVLVGFEVEDGEKERDALISQLFKLKVFPSINGNDDNDGTSAAKPWNATVRDIDGEVLLVSQFTLNAKLKSGKPSFHRSMKPEPAKVMWDSFVSAAQEIYGGGERVKACVFGSMMSVHLVNDGPFTICLNANDGKCTTW